MPECSAPGGIFDGISPFEEGHIPVAGAGRSPPPQLCPQRLLLGDLRRRLPQQLVEQHLPRRPEVEQLVLRGHVKQSAFSVYWPAQLPQLHT